MSSLLNLNYDVLSLVLGLISPHDANQFALVCRDAYTIAMPRVLADVSLGGAFHKPVSSPATQQLTNFCAFMLADVQHRLVHLQSLEIRRDAVRRRVGGAWVVDTECVRLLAAMLEKAVHLHKVTIWGFDALVVAYPPIVDTLARCLHLHSVFLGGDIPSLSTLGRAFPHVRDLHFIGGSLTPGPDWNLIDAYSSGPIFPRLDHIESGQAIISLACPVRRVNLLHPLVPDEAALTNTLQYIQNTQPIALSVAVDASVTDAEFIARIPEVACNLKYLEIALHGCESLAAVTAWMMRIGALLADLPLLGLSLSSSTSTSFPSPFSSPAASPPSSPGPIFATLPDVDDIAPAATPMESITLAAPRSTPPTSEMIANSVASAIHCLRYVSLQPHGPGWSKHNVDFAEWFHTGGRVTKMNEDEGTRIGRILRGLDIYD